jgi:aminopeptidase
VDPRVIEHAKILVNYCTEVKRGGNVLVEITDQDCQELAVEVCREAASHGAHPLIVAYPGDYVRVILDATPPEDLAVMPRNLLEAMKASDVDIYIISWANTRHLESVDPQRIAIRNKSMQPYFEEHLKKRWTITLHPTNAHAQDAGLSLREYRDFVYS